MGAVFYNLQRYKDAGAAFEKEKNYHQKTGKYIIIWGKLTLYQEILKRAFRTLKGPFL